MVSPTLTAIAWLILFIEWLSKTATLCFSLLLSMVRICSARITESRDRPLSWLLSATWVGSLALSIFDVMGITMVVGLYALPMSFWIISTGRVPPCSEPKTGFSSAK